MAAALIGTALIAVQTPKVQTAIANKVLKVLEDKIDGRISIGEISIDPFKAVVLKDVAVIDNDPYVDTAVCRPVDTMFKARYVTACFSVKSIISSRSIRISSAKVTDGQFFLTIEPEFRGAEADTSGVVNLKRIFRLGRNDKEKQRNDNDVFSVDNVELENMSFKMRNYRKDASKFKSDEMNWFDMEVCDINMKGRNLKMKGAVMSGVCDKMSLREKSGFTCYLLSGRTKVGNGKTTIRNLRLIDQWSNVSIPKLVMTYKDTQAWSEFITDVRMKGDIGESIVSMKTLRYFAPALKPFNLSAKVEGSVEGYVNDLHFSDIVFSTSDADGFLDWNGEILKNLDGEFSGSIIGLPDSKAMLMDAQIKKISFTSYGLENFIHCWAPGTKLGIRQLCKGERLWFNGTLRGPLNRMAVRGTVNSNFGKIKANAELRNVIDRFRPLLIGGTVETDGLDISHIIGNVPVGKCDMQTSLSAVIDKDTLGATIDSLKISRLNVLGYDYTGIAAAGTFSQSAFDGRIVCSDPNLNFLFQGIFSLSSKSKNALYQFYANLGYADLHALNIDKRGTSKMSLSTTANFTRISGEDIYGDIGIHNIVLEDTHGVHNVGDVTIKSFSGNNLNRLVLKSKFAEGSFSGTRFLASFIKDLQTITTKRDLPSLYSDSSSSWEDNQYSLSLKFHDTQDILSFFAPGTYIADSTEFNMDVNRDGAMSATLRSGRIAYRNKYIKRFRLNANNLEGNLVGSLKAEEISVPPILTKSDELRLYAQNDTLGLSINYDNDTEKENRGAINITGHLLRDSNNALALEADFLPSFVYLNSDLWNIESDSIRVSRGAAHVGSLSVYSAAQNISVNGGYSKENVDTLHLNLDKFDLSMINAFTKRDMGIKGLATGHAMLVSPTKDNAGILMNIACDSTEFGGQKAGTVKLACVWDDEAQGFNYLCRNSYNDRQNFNLTGNLYPKDRRIEGKLSLDSLNIGHAKPFLETIFSEISGSVSGDIAFIGPLNKIEIYSRDLSLNQARMKVGFTNVAYTANGGASLDSHGVSFDNVKVNDRFNAGGNVTGRINWNYFKDISFDTHIRFDRMEVVDLRETDNPFFYGNIFATGDLAITGPLNALLLEANASTSNKGDIHIPLNSSSTAGTSNLLTFKEPYKEIVIDPYEELMKRLKEKDTKQNDLDIRLRVNATPDVSAVIEIDKNAGNILTGNGNGRIDLDIKPSTGQFNINGNYNVTSGIYHFVALGIAKRDFTIQEGSSVHFNGEVMDSDLNINAMYKTKASVGTLIADTTSTTRRTVECGISVTGKLSNPSLDFSINVPDLDPTTQNKVESALNTQDKVQKQLLALLISNSFIPDEQSGVTNTSSSMLYSNISEIMSGQLNNILQKLNIPVDLGLDYQQNNSGSDIFDVALSTALFNNRVIVNGTIGNRQYDSNTSGSEVVGDLDIDVKLDKPGALRLNLFSHSADQYTNYLDNSQRNGVGITYQKEYDTFGEFIRNMFRSKKKKQRMELERQQELQNERRINIRIDADDKPEKDK